MSDLNENNKRPAEEDIDIASLYNDPQELVNAVVSVLTVPEATTNVSENYANDKNQATEVQAYAKIAGNNWTYYVKTLSIGIGRNTDQQDEKEQVHIDLGPAKVVSRLHANISYNLNTRLWELLVSGRNGAKVDSVKVPCGSQAVATPLRSGSVIDIGGTQMMFILPDASPVIASEILALMAPKIPRPLKRGPVTGVYSVQNMKQKKQYDNGDFGNSENNNINSLKGFQIFSQDHSSSTDILTPKGFDNDLSKDEARDIKPPFSYATMITQAILSNKEGVLSLSEIYDWIASHYAFYRFSKTGWQNSIRHNLSLNKAFDKVPRRANEPGKGMKWQISDSYKADFMKKVESGSLSKVRRGSSVSRQLQLHLATHSELPQSQDRHVAPQTPPQNNQTQHQKQEFAYNQYPKAQSHQVPLQNGALQYLGSVQQQQQQHNQSRNGSLPPPAPPVYRSTSPQRQFEPLAHSASHQGSPERPHVFVNTRPASHESNVSSDRTEIVQSSQAETGHIIPKLKLSSPIKKETDLRTERLTLPPVAQIDVINKNLPGKNPLDMMKSPNKLFRGTPTESYTPERGVSKKFLETVNSEGIQSSPPQQALWNYVQFSTPVKEKGSSKSNGGTGNITGAGSPIKNLVTESPKEEASGKENIQDLPNVDLAKGFQK
ncbi:hypothetical protein WICPIJ_001982 [Wickerhamomyces pijperi]|uniref:Uncharacterized protein n=1 Tax=Wickerhamomyces pijperi TaxID=599730 RepID=A0A9P8Q9Y9_WICPI|nr:hypothetical protein WICPIJ_001982 [Wickerhamomyces pijperi]